MKSPIVLLDSLWMDIHRLEPEVKGLDRDLVTIKKRFENEGYGFLAIALPSLCAALDRGLASGQFTCPMGFKSRGRAIPELFQGMFCEVFEPLTGLLKENANIRITKLLRQVLLLFKKTQLGDETNIQLDIEAKEGFFQCDASLADHITDPTMDHYLGIVCSYILKDLNSESLKSRKYKHGPGAVVEGLKGNQKWLHLVDAIRNNSFDLHDYGFDDFEVLLTSLEDREPFNVADCELTFDTRASTSTARLISVPKNSTSRRTITVEPAVNQFLQQGLNIALRDSISRCAILSNSLALTDQSLNQNLALEGSLLDNWAIIDLKSASDLLSVKLVKTVFRRHSTFLDRMMDARSPLIQSDDNPPWSMKKFAGMGNALTFPVQSICFAMICIAAITNTDYAGKYPSYWAVKRASRHVRVFGDDIIVSKRHALQCVAWLEAFGLKANRNKSFLEGSFKESCGVDAFRGVDVTPLYVRHRPDLPSRDPETIASLVSTSNQLWMSCLYSTSACLQNEVEERIRKRLPLVSRNSGVLGWHSRLDAMTSSRWNHRLHRLETQALALTPLKRRDRLDGYAALLKFFLNPRIGVLEDPIGHLVPLVSRTKDHLEYSSIRYNSRIVRKWVPTYVGD
ncbi:TPA_asm: RNA-directed RNA polymerase [ssRNA phage Zoerhiza.1_25]|uniref:RNA-directed RNA polymerase n=2 Tax=Leviviricetes TaxID=2842243 RepID=A0A8S5L229_9VIRU|nr:RNA-directed RNA polymerase [ssRNA phage Zoerhiza.1_25]QDH89613.1 MAG: RNA-dependent RNA polymerase [Leviviridae sp.]DAD51500.1 TPA_asm: RNA-directed RNA polymerase [ssRNA phage Zoerhiza.1_25]